MFSCFHSMIFNGLGRFKLQEAFVNTHFTHGVYSRGWGRGGEAVLFYWNSNQLFCPLAWYGDLNRMFARVCSNTYIWNDTDPRISLLMGCHTMDGLLTTEKGIWNPQSLLNIWILHFSCLKMMKITKFAVWILVAVCLFVPQNITKLGCIRMQYLSWQEVFFEESKNW